jgi:hypothetical protein
VVGDALAEIGSSSATDHAGGDVGTPDEHACPLGKPTGMTDDARSVLWDLDLASQLTWPLIDVIRPRPSVAAALEVERSNL